MGQVKIRRRVDRFGLHRETVTKNPLLRYGQRIFYEDITCPD